MHVCWEGVLLCVIGPLAVSFASNRNRTPARNGQGCSCPYGRSFSVSGHWWVGQGKTQAWRCNLCWLGGMANQIIMGYKHLQGGHLRMSLEVQWPYNGSTGAQVDQHFVEAPIKEIVCQMWGQRGWSLFIEIILSILSQNFRCISLIFLIHLRFIFIMVWSKNLILFSCWDTQMF